MIYGISRMFPGQKGPARGVDGISRMFPGQKGPARGGTV